MRKLIPSICVLVLLAQAVGRPTVAAADEYRPLVVVSVSSYEKLMRDVSYLGDPRLTVLAVKIVGDLLGTPVDPTTMAPAGLDTRRPWGIAVETDGLSFPTSGFLPVSSLDMLLAKSVATGKVKPPVRGVYQVKTGDQTWYVAQKGPWAWFASSPHGLETVPPDPVKLLRGLDRSHDLAARVHLKNLPEEVREAARWWTGQAPRLILPREAGESAFANALRSSLSNQGLDLAADLAKEGELLVLGVSVDPRTGSLVGELEVTYAAGTTMAESLSAPSRSTTAFRGFDEPKATLSGTWTGEIARMPLYQGLTVFDSLAGQLLRRRNQPASELWRTIREALLAEDVDGGIAISLRSSGVTLAAGGNVEDGAKLDERFRRLAEAARNRPADEQAPEWRLDAGQYMGTRFHTVSMPIPEDAKNRGELLRMFGNRLDVVIGVGEHSLYVASGKNPMAALKHVLQGSRTKTARSGPPVRLTLSVGALARFLAEMGQEDGGLTFARMADLLGQSGGRDHIRLTAHPVPRGVQLRVELQEAVLRVPRLLLPGAGPNRRGFAPRPLR